MKIRAAILLCILHRANCSNITASVNGTTYHGIHREQVETFLGIQYAHSTGGSNRFKPPVPFVPPEGLIIKATEGGLACPQELGAVNLPVYLQNVTEISEDCLRLNIARPNGTTSTSNLPVMVFVHGGGFISGSKDEPVTQPGGLILNSVANGHPVIHVAINYRLGIFGFAKSKTLRAEGSENAGLRDQRLALEWVANNIRSFGGDPSKVTIHGQSSGAASMGWQILAYGGSKGVSFQQVIAQSQVLEAGVTGNLTRDAMSRVAAATGCNTTDLEAASTVECLRDLSLDELVKAQTDTHTTGPEGNFGDVWLPSVDGDFFPAAPTELVSSGRFSNVSAIIGWCEDDANIIIAGLSMSNDSDVHNALVTELPGFNSTNIAKLEELYPASDFHPRHFANGTIEQTSSFYRVGRIFRDLFFTCQPFLLGEALTRNGNNVYYYQQNQTILKPILEASGLYGLGVVHTGEFAYVFGNFSHYDLYDFDPQPTISDIVLQWAESRSWTSFAATGHPSLPGKVTLPGWAKAEHGANDTDYGVYVIGWPTGGYTGTGGSAAARKALEAEKLQERCDFWNSPDVIKQLLY